MKLNWLNGLIETAEMSSNRFENESEVIFYYYNRYRRDVSRMLLLHHNKIVLMGL